MLRCRFRLLFRCTAILKYFSNKSTLEDGTIARLVGHQSADSRYGGPFAFRMRRLSVAAYKFQGAIYEQTSRLV
jgi:hypothetical protein